MEPRKIQQYLAIHALGWRTGTLSDIALWLQDTMTTDSIGSVSLARCEDVLFLSRAGMMSLKRDAAYRTLLLEPIESTIYEKDLQQICDMLWSYQDLCLDELAGYMCQARRYRVTLNDDKGTMLAQRVLYLGLNPAETSVVDFLQRWLTLDQVDP